MSRLVRGSCVHHQRPTLPAACCYAIPAPIPRNKLWIAEHAMSPNDLLSASFDSSSLGVQSGRQRAGAGQKTVQLHLVLLCLCCCD